jgi:hypothetical protein
MTYDALLEHYRDALLAKNDQETAAQVSEQLKEYESTQNSEPILDEAEKAKLKEFAEAVTKDVLAVRYHAEGYKEALKKLTDKETSPSGAYALGKYFAPTEPVGWFATLKQKLSPKAKITVKIEKNEIENMVAGGIVGVQVSGHVNVESRSASAEVGRKKFDFSFAISLLDARKGEFDLTDFLDNMSGQSF